MCITNSTNHNLGSGNNSSITIKRSRKLYNKNNKRKTKSVRSNTSDCTRHTHFEGGTHNQRMRDRNRMFKSGIKLNSNIMSNSTSQHDGIRITTINLIVHVNAIVFVIVTVRLVGVVRVTTRVWLRVIVVVRIISSVLVKLLLPLLVI